MDLIYWLKRFVVFRFLFAVLKHVWPILAVILFWPVIDSFLTQAIPSWIMIRTIIVVQARNIWAVMIKIPAVAQLITAIGNFVSGLSSLDISSVLG